jgi:hypothetical protein
MAVATMFSQPLPMAILRCCISDGSNCVARPGRWHGVVILLSSYQDQSRGGSTGARVPKKGGISASNLKTVGLADDAPVNLRMQFLYNRGLGPTLVVLLLTTVGRKSDSRALPVCSMNVWAKPDVAPRTGAFGDWMANIRAAAKCSTDRPTTPAWDCRSGTDVQKHRRFLCTAITSSSFVFRLMI